MRRIRDDQTPGSECSIWHCQIQGHIPDDVQDWKGGGYHAIVEVRVGLPRIMRSGNLTAELYWFLYSGVQFSAYEAMQKVSSTRVGSSFTSGAVAASVATLFTYPFDIMRTRFVYQADTKLYNHIITGITTIVKKEGVGGLYKGFLPCLVSVVPYMGGCFYILELLKSKCWSYRC